MFLIFSLMELSIIFTMIDLSQNKRPECVIGFDDNKIVYGTAGQKLTCQLEKMNTDLFDTDFNSGNVDWLNYEPDNQLIIGTPEKENVGRSNVTITVSPSSCSTLLPWTVSVTFLVELPKQTDSSASDSCTYPPSVNRPVNHIQTRTGEVFKLTLDPLTFIDQEDGSTKDLKISLKTLFNTELDENFWLKLDESSLVLYGVPLRNDLDVFVVNLVAMDKCKQIAMDSISLETKDNFNVYNHEFTVYFWDDSQTNLDVYRFINGLLRWLDISDSSQIYVSNVDLSYEISSISWVDKSMATDICERQYILDTYYRMADDNGTVLEEFNCFLSPFFNVTSVFVDFKEICNFTEPCIESDIHVSLNDDDDMYLFYILIPVAILTVVILMVIIILLVRRCLKRNRYVTNSEKPIFLMDRQPVIFQNEYNDEDTSLKPQIPIIIDQTDAGATTSALGSEGRTAGSPPSYVPQTYNSPPEYRLPPPYNISGM